MDKRAIPRDDVIEAYHLAKGKYHFTHAQIAELSGINRTRVTEILTAGKNTPQSIRPKTHRAMCKALSLNPDTLEPIEKGKTLFDLFAKILYDPHKGLPDPDMYMLVKRFKADLNNIPTEGK